MLDILADKDHDEYEDNVKWLGEPYDSEYFNPKEVKFTIPGWRLRRLLTS